MNAGKVVGLAVFALVAILGLGWLATGNDFFLYQFFAPKYEQVRHDTFKESQAYNDGMKNDLQDLWIQYSGDITPAQKEAIASTILHRFASYDESKLPPDLKMFLVQLRQERTSSKSGR